MVSLVSTGMDDLLCRQSLVKLNFNSPLQVVCKLDLRTSRKLVLPVFHTFIEETVTILISLQLVSFMYLHLGTLTSIFVTFSHWFGITHRPSWPHGTTSNKKFTLVWNSDEKGQSLLMNFIPASSR